ncbi:MAG: isoprenylcysteine carboxylmethyltransferase family protein [Anaerolineales bacterium]|jgi:protein-S-isoprenylcysteine O-methyltransferase Ste14
MSIETFFRIAIWILFGGLMVMQVYFATQVHRAGERVAADRQAIEREGWWYAVVRAISSLALITFLVLFAIYPPWMTVLSIPLPVWLRWVGVALATVSFVHYIWSKATLGRAWSPHLQTRQKHGLVTSGPYARIRHPIYLAMLGFLIGIALLVANWFFIALLAISIVVLVLRIPKEEQMMLEEFGEEYRA